MNPSLKARSLPQLTQWHQIHRRYRPWELHPNSCFYAWTDSLLAFAFAARQCASDDDSGLAQTGMHPCSCICFFSDQQQPYYPWWVK